ncbi:hypothetical protein UY3_15297 [Chelonia mydas]|uniref:Uncharacterized protein n=1 Tax=Chelonia mydas TaxID=8469 RepID=M7ASF8_CHEMY|nr:hypothetical protein UY3_15297 [Chelonia mydas]
MQSSSAEVTMMESQNRKRAPAWTEREPIQSDYCLHNVYDNQAFRQGINPSQDLIDRGQKMKNMSALQQAGVCPHQSMELHRFTPAENLAYHVIYASEDMTMSSFVHALTYQMYFANSWHLRVHLGKGKKAMAEVCKVLFSVTDISELRATEVCVTLRFYYRVITKLKRPEDAGRESTTSMDFLVEEKGLRAGDQ